MALTKKQQELANAMIAASKAKQWTAVNGYTIRYTEKCATPEWAQEDRGWGAGALYPFPTYERHVFLSLVGGKVILGVAHAPWTGRQDQYVTLKRAHAVLADPTAVF